MITQSIELDRRRTFKIFWSYGWRAYLLAMGLMLFNLASGWAQGTLGANEPGSPVALFGALVSLLALALHFALHLFVFRVALGREWSDFKLAPTSLAGEPVELTWTRTAKVYWSYAWRAMVRTSGVALGIVALFYLRGMIFGAEIDPVFWMFLIGGGLVGAVGILFAILGALSAAIRVRWSDFTLEPVGLNQSAFGTTSVDRA